MIVIFKKYIIDEKNKRKIKRKSPKTVEKDD